ncbi:MAG: hypothetical protein K9K38_06085 [Rhodoferax sp.]|nr:hypothetical protein [Rhodoferax sp.]MCF8208959.1 hypothetical protein [Rhodoferax sp.]
MAPYFSTLHVTDGQVTSQASARGSAKFRFCSGKCQEEKPPEGGVELAPGKWRCGACWIELARRRR